MHVVDEVGSPRKIDYCTRQRLVHRNISSPVANDTLFVSQGVREGHAQTDGSVFDRMMIVDLEIAFAGYFKIEQAMAREEFEHMIEKRYIRIDAAHTFTIQVQDDLHIRFSSFSFYCRFTTHWSVWSLESGVRSPESHIEIH